MCCNPVVIEHFRWLLLHNQDNVFTQNYWIATQLYQKETPTQVFSCEYCTVFKMTCFEEHLYTAAVFNYGNMYGYIIEKICCTEFKKSTILSRVSLLFWVKAWAISIPSTTFQLFSGDQQLLLLSLLWSYNNFTI